MRALLGVALLILLVSTTGLAAADEGEPCYAFEWTPVPACEVSVSSERVEPTQQEAPIPIGALVPVVGMLAAVRLRVSLRRE